MYLDEETPRCTAHGTAPGTGSTGSKIHRTSASNGAYLSAKRAARVDHEP